MKETLMLLFLLGCLPLVNHAQESIKNYALPEYDELVFFVDVDTAIWKVSQEKGYFTITPQNPDYTDKLISMFWAFEYPMLDSALNYALSDAEQIVYETLSEVEWSEEQPSFENNSISFYSYDGAGYLISDDGNKTDMLTTIMLLVSADRQNIMPMVLFSTVPAYDKYELDVMSLLMSIENW